MHKISWQILLRKPVFQHGKKFTVISYVNAKYRRDINLRLDNLKLLGEKVRITLQIVGTGKDFWIESRVLGVKIIVDNGILWYLNSVYREKKWSSEFTANTNW